MEKEIKMPTISVSSEEDRFTGISNNFIQYYMPDASGDFVKIYIYLAMVCASEKPVSVAEIADHLNCTENDICRGIKYWIKEDAIRLHYNDDNEVTGIVLLSLKRPEQDILNDLKVLDFGLGGKKKSAKTESAEGRKSEKVSEESSAESDVVIEHEAIKVPRKKTLTPDEVNSILRDPEMDDLINEATAYFNRNLAQKDLEALYYIKEQLGFSFDLCEYLLEYCAEVKKTSPAYFEKVARNWYSEGITTRDEATEYSQKYLKLYSGILKSLGISSRFSPAPVERSFIDDWTKKYGFDEAIIIEACNRAIMAKTDANFPYVNGILENWYRKGVKTPADIRRLDQEYGIEKAAKKEAQKEKKSAAGEKNLAPVDENTKMRREKYKELEQYYLNEG